MSDTPRPNLYIGLVCPAGTDLTDVKQQLKAQLVVVGYKYEEIKVSNAIKEALHVPESENEFFRIKSLMSAGDQIREKSQDGSGVASLIVTAIRASRGDEKDQDKSTAFIIDSLKNPKELEILDKIYGRNFYSISVSSSKDDRITFLANKLARSETKPVSGIYVDKARELIELDEKGQDDTGQSVRDTFPKSDFFVDYKNGSEEIRRFIRLIFQDPFITPTLDEYMMFVAKATALRSCDLSRQVGAVICSRNGTIISSGCNEVPYPGGGFYYEGREGCIDDNRDKVEQHDPNFNEVKKSITKFIEILQESEYISKDTNKDNIADDLLHGKNKKLTNDSRLRNLIEFSRVVHAEMHAITEAAANGRAVQGASLYCTTYPCHLCARHIISAGISSVIYIEPYPKSLTAELYHREIESEPRETDCDNNREPVEFRSFRGISPTLYQRVFSYRKRKDGYDAVAQWQPLSAMPVGSVANAARPEFEAMIAIQLEPILEMIHAVHDG